MSNVDINKRLRITKELISVDVTRAEFFIALTQWDKDTASKTYVNRLQYQMKPFGCYATTTISNPGELMLAPMGDIRCIACSDKEIKGAKVDTENKIKINGIATTIHIMKVMPPNTSDITGWKDDQCFSPYWFVKDTLDVCRVNCHHTTIKVGKWTIPIITNTRALCTWDQLFVFQQATADRPMKLDGATDVAEPPSKRVRRKAGVA